MKQNLPIFILLFSLYCSSSPDTNTQVEPEKASATSNEKSMLEILKEKADSDEGKKVIETVKEKAQDPEMQEKIKSLFKKDDKKK
ncbi:MAG TPA: hypothetical protein PK079_15895 [Leptospiraceae bacterium]|nr:hypothetical protein [Leptospiraceae bacterium]HMW07661.1 hypothetical protein [Leptospiraceae bacterium]HMX35484.1 hypothetical protein [Leptospiraceae bacterium]HMY33325.1 hypothetical protein [Leptospiraceae bacterium]HMZ63062.1 hypothetical protein [Leptospiraceae bacterium]